MTSKSHHGCPSYLKSDILVHQDYRCLYCMFNFGSVITRSLHKSVLTVMHWDHFVPFSYICYSPGDNWVAACNICNLYKQSLIYETLEEARTDIMDRWARDGRQCAWEPSVSSEYDGNKWAVSFASWLSLHSDEPETATIFTQPGVKSSASSSVQWTLARIADEFNFSSISVAKTWVRRHHIPVVNTQSTGRPGGQPRNLYDRNAVLDARAKQSCVTTQRI
jgi:hypothetical protein